MPNKNIIEVSGKSLIQRAIDVAAGIFPKNQIYLSTDSSKFAQIANINEIGTHSRSAFAASDSAVANDVVEDFLNSDYFQNENLNSLSLIYLQPTSPFRTQIHILESIQLHEKSGWLPVVSVRNLPIVVEKLLKRNVAGLYDSFKSEGLSTANSQTFTDEVFLPNGAIYIFKIKDFVKRNTFPMNGSIVYKMDDLHSLDIDTPEDINLANRISRNLGW